MRDWLWDLARILGGLLVLVAGGDLLVRGASQLATALRVPRLIIGLTIVAFGTSAPELAVSAQAALAGKADIAVGNVVGSNILNVLLILGLSALVVPLVVSSQLFRRDVPVMIATSFLLLWLAADGAIDRGDGLLLFCGIVAYTCWSVRQGRKEGLDLYTELVQNPAGPKVETVALLIQVALIASGLGLLAAGAHWLVDGAVNIATRVGVSQLVIGLTLVAAGTSMPEIVTSVTAAIRGERDIAVGNIVGSSIFNILCVLGLSGLLAPRPLVVPATALSFDIPVMIAVAVACLPIFFTGNRIARWEGALFLCYYVVYTTYLVMDAMRNAHARTLAMAMIFFVGPLTILTLAISVYRNLRIGQAATNSESSCDAG
jgi:cation:H+ antiporter